MKSKTKPVKKTPRPTSPTIKKMLPFVESNVYCEETFVKFLVTFVGLGDRDSLARWSSEECGPTSAGGSGPRYQLPTPWTAPLRL